MNHLFLTGRVLSCVGLSPEASCVNSFNMLHGSEAAIAVVDLANVEETDAIIERRADKQRGIPALKIQ